MKEQINELIQKAEKDLFYSDSSSTAEYGTSYALQAIARSLIAITKMFATDYEKTLHGGSYWEQKCAECELTEQEKMHECQLCRQR